MKKIALFFLLISIIILFFPEKLKSESLPIIINQIMIGQDSGSKNEFIELYNPNNFSIDLSDYSLKKKTISGSESSLVSNKNFQGIIGPYGYFLISSPEFCPEINCDLKYSSSASLSKNNSIILYNNKNISDKLGYGEAIDFYVQAALEPANNQVLKRDKVDFSNINNFIDFYIKHQDILIRNSQNDIIKIKNETEEKIISTPAKKTNNTKDYVKIELKNINNLKKGDLVITQGVVSVLPGVLGSQYFYIHNQYQNNNNNNKVHGVQIYNYNKKFPELKIGDLIEVWGEVSTTESNNVINYKIKTKDNEDIKTISHNNIITNPLIDKIKNLQKEEVGFLKKIKGEITQNKTSQIYLDDDNEIIIEIKKGTEISSKSLKEGEIYEVTGIFGYSSNQKKITPLRAEDIISINLKEDNQYMSEVLNEEFWEIKSEQNKKNILTYLITSIIAVILFFVFNKKI